MENVKEVNGKELKELIGSGKTVVCDFWAPWCMPCRMLAPAVDAMAGEFAGKAEFVKLNIDENGETAAEFSVMSIPDVIVFRSGKKAAHSLGYVPEEGLREFFTQNL